MKRIIRKKQKEKGRKRINPFKKALLTGTLLVAGALSLGSCGDVECHQETENLRQNKTEYGENINGEREEVKDKLEKEICVGDGKGWIESEKHEFQPPIELELETGFPNAVDIDIKFFGKEMKISEIYLEKKNGNLIMKLTDTTEAKGILWKETETFDTSKGKYEIKIVSVHGSMFIAEITNEKGDKIEQECFMWGITESLDGIKIIAYNSMVVPTEGDEDTLQVMIGVATETVYLADGYDVELTINEEKIMLGVEIDADIEEIDEYTKTVVIRSVSIE
ncbi:hypothetical protein KAW38_00495 [Candidatus Micrarchaeota archaeon]|nr:hypothetical protein [Candidatus Micrarchaeota archaeon]